MISGWRFFHKSFSVLLAACLALAMCAFPGPWNGPREALAAPSDVPDPQFWETNGYVDEIVSDGDTVYIGGIFPTSAPTPAPASR